MNCERLLRAIAREPWYMDEAYFMMALQAMAAGRVFLESGRITINMAEVADQAPADEPGSNLLSTAGEVGVVDIKGTIGIGWDDFEKKYLGVVDCHDVVAAVGSLVSDENIDAIVLNIDSPGGFVVGTQEAAERIAEFKQAKPIVAFTEGMMCSAAYFLGSGCDAIYSTKSALVGSIGVYMPLLDMSGLYEKLGLKLELFRTGAYKGAGYPGKELTDDERENFQAHVDFAFEQFSGHVTEHRPQVGAESMQGQALWGQECIEHGLVDSVVPDLNAVIQEALLIASMSNPEA